MTETGCQAARTRIPIARAVTLAPLDCSTCVRRFLKALRPRAFLLAETELWPNYLLAARRAEIPVAIINGRLSERSFARYRVLQSMFRPGLESVALVLAQSDEDADRYAALGVARSRIAVVGNPKFDCDWLGDIPSLRPQLESFAHGRRMFVAGSTAPGEEAIVIDAYCNLRCQFPDLALVLAPRHPARAAEVETLLRTADLDYVRAAALGDQRQERAGSTASSQPDGRNSALVRYQGDSRAGDRPADERTGANETIRSQAARKPSEASDQTVSERATRAHVLLLDTLGELRALYFHATLAFVGGSIQPGRGGQSLAEPAAAALPVMFGPHHESQRVVAQALMHAGAGYVVRNAEEIVDVGASLLRDASLRRAKGESARAALRQLGGAAERSLLALARLGSLG
jgi:3-deoxy-D-manno-octulosonic-acid transferase